jgi:hypothetical protein
MGMVASRGRTIAIAFSLLAGAPSESPAAPANSLKALWRQLGACLQAPSSAEGSEITIVFALKRDGSLLGTPRITHSRLVGDIDAQRAFVGDALKAFAKCLPLSVSDGLGGAVAGRLFSIRIRAQSKETES